ncbi:EAL domain-containing protein [Modicisalibacter tunisiensis]|uniref:sensor domain-containing phosphodiesterase n=1 Tax=Modicisalibacter tunisiensis TaxID=390637 RepID=UPI001CCA8306|nr:EAL domain-containing protein [Modicisalibacter tunisiensis]MBZ9538292.1 EAL domain-containing protein [Modicisalibacter tunisiensis]
MTTALQWLEAQQNIHEMIARQAPLTETLAAVADWAGRMLPDALVSIMRYDATSRTLSQVPGALFSREYVAALQDVGIDPEAGSCGSAAFHRRLTVTEDIHQDAKWTAYRALAEREGLRACWSMPVLSGEDELLGTFGVYHRRPAAPSERDCQRMQQAASLVALAVIRDRDARSRRSLEARYRALYDQHPDGVYEFDTRGYFQRCNPALERILGYPEAALLGRHFREFVLEASRELTRERFGRALAGEVQHYELVARRADGTTCDVEVTNFPIMVDGETVGVFGICRDISARKARDERLRLLQRGIEDSPNGVVMADATRPDLPLIYVNRAFTAMTGYPPEELLGRNCRLLQGSGTDPAAVARVRQALEANRDIQVVLRNYRRDGTPFWNQLSLAPVLDEQGECTHFIGMQQDVTRQREQEARLTFQARHDTLTELPNRASLEARLDHDHRQSRRRGALLVLMIIDLDDFKSVNDGLGYEAGNQLLVAVAHRLRAFPGAGDTLARLAADEFALLMPGLANEAEAIALAERMLEALTPAFTVAGQRLHVSASIGLAGNQQPLEHPRDLLLHANLATQQAKGQGRNTWQWYAGGADEAVSERVRLRRDIQEAIERDQFELHYQPIVEAASGRLRSVEALVRWRHPERGMISPGVFIPLAEQTGQIIALGRWVLRRACRDMAALNAERASALPVAVNISPLQFRRQGFLAEVEQALADSGLPAAQLELEVTEGVLMSGAESAIALLSELRARGIRMAIDDFGTGFSSLSYLRDLPITKVKLDRAFIQDITTKSDNAAIVQGVITMAHHLGLSIVAEGVETPAQRRDLMRRGCDLLQGFLFARPMPLAELRALPACLPVA